MTGYIHSTESFGSVDGPGVRFIIFMQGCPMRCRYCHNPDTWAPSKDNAVSADELLGKAERYRSYWGKEGGITVSGGEPLMQAEFVAELFEKAHSRGINTCLDTSAVLFSRNEPLFGRFRKVAEHTDLFLLDIKHIDDAAHKSLTGHGNGGILDCARFLSEIGKPVWVRHVLVPGVTDEDVFLHRLKDFLDTLGNIERVEVLPYHTLGIHKWKKAGIPYTLEGVSPPSEERLRNARTILGAI